MEDTTNPNAPPRFHDILFMPQNAEDCACDECWFLYWRERAMDIKALWPYQLPYRVEKIVAYPNRIKCSQAEKRVEGGGGCDIWIEVSERYALIETLDIDGELILRSKHYLHLKPECVEGFVAEADEEVREGMRRSLIKLVEK